MMKTCRHEAHDQGQVVVLFALLLPMILIFVSFSIGVEMWFSARSHLDEATITAALAAADQSCMSSYQNTTPYATPSSPPYPCYLNNILPPAGGATVIPYNTAAENAVYATLFAEYPGRTITKCSASSSAATCQGMASGSATVVYQVEYMGSSGAFGPTPAWVSASCSAATPYVVELQANVWMDFAPAIPQFAGPTTLLMESSHDALGCLGGVTP